MRLDDEGEIFGRAPTSRVHRSTTASVFDEYGRTGLVGVVDDELPADHRPGSDIIIRGARTRAQEIEVEELIGMPSIAEVAVSGALDARLGRARGGRASAPSLEICLTLATSGPTWPRWGWPCLAARVVHRHRSPARRRGRWQPPPAAPRGRLEQQIGVTTSAAAGLVSPT